MKSAERDICFYCGGLVSCSGHGDHFPVPKSCGGKTTVPCCVSCHDMKDRFGLYEWPAEWVSAVILDMPKMSRETRLFLARTTRIAAEALNKLHKKQ